MKRYIYIIMISCIALTIAACDTTKVESVDGSVGERVEKVVNEYTSELCAAENGWIANIMTSQGIYRFWMDFDDNNTVKMITDNTMYPALKTEVDQSTYNLRSLQRPTLSFDTYSYVSIICDPDNSISGGSGNKGLKTDFEFEIDHYENNCFYMRGRTNRVATTLTKASAAEKAAIAEGSMMDVLDHITSYYPDKFLFCNIGSTKVGVSLGERMTSFSYIAADNETVLQKSVYTYVDINKNVIFNEQIDLAGTIVTGLKWDKSTSSYSMVNANQGLLSIDMQDTPIIPLIMMFGPGKPYGSMASLGGMYNPTSPMGVMYSQTAAQILRVVGSANALAQMTITFGLSEAGAPQMTLVYMFGRYQAGYTYPLTMNSDGTVKVGSTFIFDIVPGNASLLYDNGTKTLVDYLKGKTLKVDWSMVKFPGYEMGQLIDTSNPSWAYIGALM